MRRSRLQSLPFVGIDVLGERPHIMVDGAGRPGSVLVLSHWPVTSTPSVLARDLSAEIAFAYLDRGRVKRKAVAVTCDHFDEDGMASIFALSDPQSAFLRRREMVEFARVGDFGVVRDERIARAVLAFRALCDPQRSELFDDIQQTDLVGNSWTRIRYERLLTHLGGLIDHPEQHRELYGEDEAAFSAGRVAISSGACEIEEIATLDLAVVRVGQLATSQPRHEIGHGASLPIHEWAIHSATAMPRVLVLEEGRACYYDRYETWVRYVSRSLPLRRDLSALGDRLSHEDPSGARWTADPPGSLVPVLSLGEGEVTALAPDRIVDIVTSYLRDAPIAWDPFHPNRPLAATNISASESDES